MSSSLTKRDNLVTIVLSKYVTQSNLDKLFGEALSQLANNSEQFYLLLDCRYLLAFTVDAQLVFDQLQHFFMQNHLDRSCVIFNSKTQAGFIRSSSIKSGLIDDERYISASRFLNWREHAMSWLLDGKEPPGNSKLVVNTISNETSNNFTFIRHGKGWRLNLALTDNVDMLGFQETVSKLQLEIEDLICKYGIKLSDPINKSISCSSEACKKCKEVCFSNMLDSLKQSTEIVQLH